MKKKAHSKDIIEVTQYDLGTMCHFAFRYALGRMSTAPTMVADTLTYYWKSLSQTDRSMILKELYTALLHDLDTRKDSLRLPALGMDCDRETWLDLFTNLSALEESMTLE